MPLSNQMSRGGGAATATTATVFTRNLNLSSGFLLTIFKLDKIFLFSSFIYSCTDTHTHTHTDSLVSFIRPEKLITLKLRLT